MTLTPGNEVWKKSWNNFQDGLYVGKEEGWRLELIRCETITASSEGADGEECLSASGP